MSKLDNIINTIVEDNPTFKGKVSYSTIEYENKYKKLILIKLGDVANGILPSQAELQDWVELFKPFVTDNVDFMIVPNIVEVQEIVLEEIKKKGNVKIHE